MIFDDLEHNRKRKRTQVLALVDPDSKNDSKLPQIMDIINISDFDAILVGGSSISDDRFEDRISYINNKKGYHSVKALENSKSYHFYFPKGHKTNYYNYTIKYNNEP